jgi:cobalamin synthase
VDDDETPRVVLLMQYVGIAMGFVMAVAFYMLDKVIAAIVMAAITAVSLVLRLTLR